MVKRLMALLGAALLVGNGAAAVAARDVRHAEATIADAAGATIGRMTLVEDGTGRVHVNAHVSGLATGLHGIHLHAVGSCTPTFAAAGPHYNPLGRQHGLDNPLGAHAGDLPNLVVNVSGIGHINAWTEGIRIGGGPTALLDGDGSAVIIHANPDDQVTDATNGGSGGRIACGVIEPD